jgi:pimeloyl-ACP methyl ester carboxylesterase
MQMQQLPDGSLSYLDSDRDDRQKPLVLLLHSSASTSGQWRRLIELLAGRYRLVAPDLVGYGATPMPAGELTVADEVSRLDALTERLGRPFHLVGHSYGGAVALELARAVGHRVRSLALFEPVAFHLLRASGDVEAWQEIEAVARRHLALVREGALAAAADAFTGYWMGPGAFTGMPTQVQVHVAAAMPKVAAEFRMAFELDHGTDAYRSFRFPILLMSAGRSTLAARRTAEILREALPQPSWEVLPQAGHMAPVMQADLVNASIAAFLDRTEASAARARAA